MRQLRRRTTRLTGLALVAVLLAAGTPRPASAEPGQPDPAAIPALRALASGRPQTHTITLITGDTVHVRISAQGVPEVRTDVAPRPDGRQVLVQALVDADNLYVLPSDAADLIAAGRLDRRLFDVRRLIADGYTDAAASTLPVIVSYAGRRADLRSASARAAAQATLRARADALPASEPVRTLESVNGASLTVTKKQARVFWSTLMPKRTTFGAGVDRVWLDAKVHASLDESVPFTGAPQAWAAGLDGTGVKVAVLDTGIDATHPDVAGKVVASRSFVPGVPTVADGHGHGTHVAATIAGGDSRYRGMAPGASLVVGKVLADSGSGEDSWIIDGMEWATASGAKVVSMSLGGDPTDGTDPMSQAVDSLTASTGALFVIAAGNDGPGARTVATPGAADAALTVAAVDKSGVLADFSSRGPRLGNYALKPEIAAPGVDITAAKPGGGHQAMSGTSMATPHVAGAAAILAQQHPDWTASQLKAALIGATRDDSHTVYQTGAGQLDVAAAVRTAVVPETSTVDYGRLRYPQEGPPVTRTVTYRNTGTQPVTLAVSGALTDEHGAAAPAGMLTVAPASIEVPAGGTADVTVTLDPTLGPTGLYSGQVLATADGVTLRTPIGAYKEPRGFDLTVNLPDKAGPATTRRGSLLIRRTDRDTGEWIILPALGVTSVHLDEGVYAVTTVALWDYDSNELNNAVLLADPQVDLRDGDATITLDMNQAVPLEVITDRPTEQYGTTLNVWHVAEGATQGFGEVSGQLPYGTRTWALPTEQATVGKFFFDHAHLLGTPVITARVPQLGNRLLHARYQHYSASVRKLDGKGKLPIVDAGQGTAADLARVNVRGKVALIDVGDKALVPLLGVDSAMAEIERAAAAGATAVLAYGNEGMPLLATVPMTYRTYPVPTLAIPAEEGQALRAQLAKAKGKGKASLAYEAQPTIPHLYTLSYFDQGGVPAAQRHHVKDRDLATLPQRQYGDRPVVQTKTFLPTRPSLLTLDSLAESYSAVSLLDIAGPLTRTEHIGPVSGTTLWSRSVSTHDLVAWLPQSPAHTVSTHLGNMFTADVFDRPVTKQDAWGQSPTPPGAVLVPDRVRELMGTDGPFCVACRYAGVFPSDILPVFTLSVDAGNHYGELTSYSNNAPLPGVDEIHLYANGTELPQQSFVGTPGVLPFYALPSEPAEYRLTQRFQDAYPRGGFGTKAESTWTFRSQAPSGKEVPAGYDSLGLCAVSCRVEPMIFLRYDFNLGLDNRLPAGGVHLFTVTPYRQPSTVQQPTIVGCTISASYDGGRTWTRLPALRLFNGEYLVLAKHPRRAGPTGTVSLRTEAWDAAGNRVVQTLTDAYGLTDRH